LAICLADTLVKLTDMVSVRITMLSCPGNEVFSRESLNLLATDRSLSVEVLTLSNGEK